MSPRMPAVATSLPQRPEPLPPLESNVWRAANDYQAWARDFVVGALNSAMTWDEHPSYNDKSVVLRGLTSSEDLLRVFADAEDQGNRLTQRVVLGIDREMLHYVLALVRIRRGTSNGAVRTAVQQSIVQVRVGPV